MSNEKEIYELADSTASFCGKLYNALEKSVGFLREDNIKDGLDLLSPSFEGLGWVVSSADSLNKAAPESFSFDIPLLNGFLEEMVGASENMDYVLLADLTEYEILPIIEKWGTSLDDYLEKNRME